MNTERAMSTESVEVVVPLRGRMSEAQYEAERAKIPATKQEARTLAAIRWEQDLAVLFWRSQWTQHELAAKEGKPQPYITRLVRFGRFLNFMPTGINIETAPNNLSERRFRDYWDQTTKGDDERDRFRAVIELMQSDICVKKPRRSYIGHKVKAQLADGQWRTLEEIAEVIEEPVDHVADMLDTMRKFETYGCKAEKKKVGTDQVFRIFKIDNRAVSIAELVEKLSPILKGLDAESKKTIVTMAPANVAILAHKLRKLLKEWSEGPSDDRT